MVLEARIFSVSEDELSMMKLVAYLIAAICFAGASCATFSDNQNINLLPRGSKDEDFRFKRQSNGTTTTTTTTTTTQRPRKNRPGNIFQLVSTLIAETRDDTGRAFNEIGRIFNAQFSAPTPKPAKNQHHAASSPPTESDEDNEITTTTEPYRITRDEFFGLLRSNVQGLMRLFQKELRNALRDSNKNARQFGKEFRNAIMPYVT